MQRSADRFYRGELVAYGTCQKCRIICKFRSLTRTENDEYRCPECGTLIDATRLATT